MTPVNNLNNTNIQDHNSDSINIANYIRNTGIGNRINLPIHAMNISTLPESINEFQNIEIIHIANTPITSLPESIGTLSNLRRILLDNTSLRVLPESIGDLPNLEIISIFDTPITALPESIGNLRNLENLTISNAPISTLPDSIGNIHNLYLSLTNTRITALPNTITNLSRIESDPTIPLSPGLIEHMESRRQMQEIRSRQVIARAFRQRRDAESTQNRPSRPSSLNLQSRRSRPLSRLDFNIESSSFQSNVHQLYASINKLMPEFTNVQNIPSIREWLEKIVSRENSNTLAPVIIEILEYAEKTPAFRERFAINIEASLGSCDDRVSLYINYIYMEKQLFSIDRTSSSELVNFLLHVAFPISLIDDIATQKSISMGIDRGQSSYEEEIEIYLAYLIRLNTRLSLGLPISTMLFETISTIQPQDIDAAEEFLRDKMSNSNEYIPFLIAHPAWIEFLQTTYPQEMKEIDEKAVDIIEMGRASSIDLMNQAENAKTFRNSYLALLTQNHLRQ